MIKQIFFTWVQFFFAVIAISYLVSLKYPEFEPKPIYSRLIFSFIFAVVVQVIKVQRAKQKS
ncbi:MAG: hypothetical protein JWP12_3163 [Bacteroidetes bacterium]|nr:hypothetical protein [Bacteroidota bacterium]